MVEREHFVTFRLLLTCANTSVKGKDHRKKGDRNGERHGDRNGGWDGGRDRRRDSEQNVEQNWGRER